MIKIGERCMCSHTVRTGKEEKRNMSKATTKATYLLLKMDVVFVPERECSGRARQLVKGGGRGEGPPVSLSGQGPNLS